MYNSGGNGNGDRNRTYSSYETRNTYTSGYTNRPGIRVGGMTIKPLYLYIAGGVLLLFALYFLMRLLNTGLVMHFSMLAGVLLLLANLREVLGKSYARHNNTALLNTLIGGALMFAWLSQFLGALLWVPAIVMLGIAAPLAIGRASVYQTYVRTARGAMGNLRQMAGRMAGRWN